MNSDKPQTSSERREYVSMGLARAAGDSER